MLIEAVDQVVLRDDLERGGREKITHAILDFIWERYTDVDVTT